MRPATTGSSSTKRPRGTVEGRPAYPRKRAAQACLTCRRKRIKCDNERPSCTSCTALAVECVYNDGDKSSYDSASLAILHRLDHLEELFKVAHPEASGSGLPQSPNPQSYPYPTTSPIPAPELFTPATVSNRDNSSAPCPINIETILDWPVLRVHTSPLSLDVKALLRTDTGSLESRPLLSSDIDTNGALSLLQLFLDNFHIYNPILKVEDVEEYVSYTVFNGLGWDAKSCLLVGQFDLAQWALDTSRQDRGTISAQDDLAATHETSSGFRQTESFHRAEAFFLAAQKRMGLLLCKNGIVEAQVFFLAGVYLMATLRPVEAWKMFVQALACCQSFSPGGDEEESQLHRSIFWTCFKSELELRLELNMIETSAWNLRYPAFFPEPPKSLQSGSETVWYFYLAEIALRRLGNRVLMYIYRASFTEASLQDEISAVLDFEQQANSWSESLPEALNLESSRPEDLHGDDANHGALRFILRGHLLDCYEFMYWPFIIKAVGGRLGDDTNSQAHLLARRGFEVCVKRVTENESGFKHRHHGTWLMLRSCTRSALVLLAAARSGVSTMLAQDWEASVVKVMDLLRYWQDETKDAADKKEILEALLGSTAV